MTASSRLSWMLCAVGALLLSSGVRSQEPSPPDDNTAEVEERRALELAARSTARRALESEEREGREGAEKDDPTYRLEWQRKAWGVPSASFRDLALRYGSDHSSRKHARGPRWVNIGPTDAEYEQNGSFTGKVRDSGRARTVLPHPWNPDVVYFLTSGGGLWRTDNWTSKRIRWTPLTDDLPTTGGGSVAFGRSPRTLYLGLGDPFDQIQVGGAMVRSKNSGQDWSAPIELGTAVSVRDVKVDTSARWDIVLAATDAGLYRSADGGQSYTAAPELAGLSVWSIERTSAGWLASAQPCPAAAVGLRCGLPTILYLSRDRGATWARAVAPAGNVFPANGRTTLGVARPGDSVVYAYSSTVNDSQMSDVYRSSDGGQTWVANGVNATKVPTNPIPGSMPDMNICHGQCWYNQMVLVDPRDDSGNTLWIGGDLGSARSQDGGVTWTIATWWLYSQVPGIPYAHADHHAAAFKPTGTPTIILGNDGGMNISEDDGATFSSDKNKGLVSHLFYTVAGSPDLPNLVIGGTQDNGTRLRVGNKSVYNQVIGGDGMGTAHSQANTNTLMGSAQGSSMRTNLVNDPSVFQNWVGATAGLADVGAGFFTAIIPAPAALDPSGRVFFHFTNARAWRTNNGGLNWNLIGSAVGVPSPGLPPTRRFRSSPYNLGVSPTDLNRIAVGAGGGFLDITTDGGATWTDLDLIARVPGYQGFVTNVTWQDDRNLWITSVAQAAGAVRVIKGTIASPGASWSTASFTPMQNGLPDLPVTRVYFDPRDAARATIYAATHVGIYRTVDGGANWESYGAGLPTVRVNDIYMPPDGGFMRIATYGRGLWELPQIELVRAVLTDDGRSCDYDGVLDNGESGQLEIKLKNQGSRTVHGIRVRVSSSNPHVRFPRGRVIHFPAIEGRGQAEDSIRVALRGAVGIETTDFELAIEAEELGLSDALRVKSTHALNYDDRRRASTTESVESGRSGWTVAGDPTTSPNVAAWQRRALSPLSHVFWGPDNNGQTDGERPDLPDEQSLVSPILRVGSDPLLVSFKHRFAFEGAAWDGGVIELSADGGASWTDVGGPLYNGATNAVTSAPIGASKPAFVNRITGWPSFTSAALNLGTAYAGQTVQLRFRIGADESTGAPGWEIDDIAVSGLLRNPFAAHVAETQSCRVRHW